MLLNYMGIITKVTGNFLGSLSFNQDCMECDKGVEYCSVEDLGIGTSSPFVHLRALENLGYTYSPGLLNGCPEKLPV